MLFLWVDGGLAEAGTLLPLIIFNGSSIPFLLALMQLLDHQAVTALNTVRPALELTEPQFDEYLCKLSTMPSRATLLAGLPLLVLYLLIERLGVAPARFAPLEQLPIFAIVFHVLDKSPAVVFGAFFYHTVRQLRLVNTIHSNHMRINLFHLGPNQAFSRLTASTAVGLVAGILGWMLINPDLLADPISLGFAGTFTILAVAVFVWPLLGAHRLMEVEKARRLHDVDRCFEAAFSEFNQLLRDGDYAAVERLNGAISSLEIQHRRIRAIPTWPWRPETARLALTAIALPLLVTMVQVVVAQMLGR